jgi:ABC-2 type transport system ATP-binding protein
MASMTTEGLSRRFGKVTAVNALTLELPEGGVVGLVGPNGSGKSTLIRMVLGLIRPTGGTATVLGGDIRHPSRYSGDVGALIESPAFVPALSARRNLTSLARLRGLPLTRVDEVLDMVGLAGRDTEPVKAFSLGMKQRLGIAAALLPDPRLLILDEPTNGLDPAGIVEIRALLQRLGSEGRTVIVSSHLLAEIEAACDYIVVIRFGELMFAGPIDELMARTRAHIDIAAEHEYDHDRLSAYLAGAGWTVQDIDGGLRLAAEQGAGADINRAAAEIGITLASLTFAQDSLEDIFLAMTGTSDGELAAHRAAAAVEAVA